MRTRKKKGFGWFDAFVLALAIVGLGYLIWFGINWWYHKGSRRAIAGIDEPKQSDVTGSFELTKGDFECTVTLKCSYDMEGLVVHTKEYSGSDIDDLLAPVDLGMAWGKVAELNEKIDFNWEQRNRRCIFSGLTDADVALAGGMDEIAASFSNNHMIPAEKNVEKDIRKIRAGDHVRIRGYLVNIDGVNAKDGQTFYWYTSLTREDTGDGACELIYVTNVDWIEDED